MAQVVEQLPGKHKALGSNLCTEKKKKRKGLPFSALLEVQSTVYLCVEKMKLFILSIIIPHM
jgi:hypothetical protein